MAPLVTVLRRLAWIVVIGAVLVGGTGTPAPRTPRTPPTLGPYTILAADFHVHSFPGDGGLLPWDLVDEARRRSLDVIALTNHNSMWSWELAQRFGMTATDVMVLPGVEQTAAGYHMTAIGVHAPVPWRQSAASAASQIHEQGGVAIAAHPPGRWPEKWDTAAILIIDGIEAASSKVTIVDSAPFTRRVMVRRPAIAAIGASDFHYFAPIGVSRTYLFVTERTRAGVLDAIRRGRTVACDGIGDTYGPAELTAEVANECRRVATAPPAGSRSIDGLAAGAAWCGLVVLIALGARERISFPGPAPPTAAP